MSEIPKTEWIAFIDGGVWFGKVRRRGNNVPSVYYLMSNP